MIDKVLIIAEAGVNHNGDLNIAKKLIESAKESGADIVKFQTFKAEKLVSKFAKKAEYQEKTTDNKESQFDMIKKLELTREHHIELINHCRKCDIEFLSTPFDLDSIDLLHELSLNIFKIPSGEITNIPYLRKIGTFNKQVILSTGMANMGEIETALTTLTTSGTNKDKITILHCNTEYPTPFEDVNLNAMMTIKNTFKINIGYSDHTKGIEIPIAAVALGAKVIEKHFTLNRNMIGPDHKASLEPNELKQMVNAIRNIEIALGNGIKEPSKSEMKNKEVARKSIVASKYIIKGEEFCEDNLTIKRPGNGIPPALFDLVKGKIAKRNFNEDELIEL